MRPMRLRAAVVVIVLAGAAAAAADGLVVLAPVADGAAQPPAPWRVVGLPNQRKPYTEFDPVDLDGERVLRVRADRSFGNLLHPLPDGTPATTLRWQWRVDDPIEASDLRRKSGDDSAIEICALFDLPLSQLPFMDRQLLRGMRLASRDPVPSASVCYVWDPHFAPGTVLDNAFTRRVRMIVLQGEGASPRRWSEERRDLRADFLRLFGDESREVPPLTGIAVSADADNTQSHSLAYVRRVALEP